MERMIKVSIMNEEQQKAIRLLKKHKKKLDWQEYRTLWGQILANEPQAAVQGLRKILSRDLEKNYWKNHRRVI